ncbi:hypothetical protein WDW37_18140 [Bdellovibrionota bacterium FG-1]
METSGQVGDLFLALHRLTSRGVQSPYGSLRYFAGRQALKDGTNSKHLARSKIEDAALENFVKIVAERWRNRRIIKDPGKRAGKTKLTKKDMEPEGLEDALPGICVRLRDLQNRLNEQNPVRPLFVGPNGSAMDRLRYMAPEPGIVIFYLLALSCVEYDIDGIITALKLVSKSVKSNARGQLDFERHFCPLYKWLDAMSDSTTFRLGRFNKSGEREDPALAFRVFIQAMTGTERRRRSVKARRSRKKERTANCTEHSWIADQIPEVLSKAKLGQSRTDLYRSWSIKLMQDLLIEAGETEETATEELTCLFSDLKGKTIRFNGVVKPQDPIHRVALPDPEYALNRLRRLHTLACYREYITPPVVPKKTKRLVSG